ncbi:MAG TPA: tetratricopeptide repeat protein [Opitutaceae bacterium]
MRTRFETLKAGLFDPAMWVAGLTVIGAVGTAWGQNNGTVPSATGSQNISASKAADSTDLAAAIASYHQKNNPAARAQFEKIIAADPKCAEAYFYLGKIERREKNFDAAAADEEKATQLAPDRAEYFIALGDAYGKLANESRSFSLAEQSCAALEHAVGLAPRSEEARAALIDFCRKAPSIVGGGLPKAYRQAEELRKLDGPAGTRLLITLYADEGRDTEAFQAGAETLKNHPDDYGLLFALGRLSASDATHLDVGEADLRKCLTLPVPEGFPDHTAAHLRLGQILQKQNRADDARAEFKAVLAASPDNAEAKAALTELEKSQAH